MKLKNETPTLNENVRKSVYKKVSVFIILNIVSMLFNIFMTANKYRDWTETKCII